MEKERRVLVVKLSRKKIKNGARFKFGEVEVIFKAGKLKDGMKAGGYYVMIDAPKDIKVERIEDE